MLAVMRVNSSRYLHRHRPREAALELILERGLNDCALEQLVS